MRYWLALVPLVAFSQEHIRERAKDLLDEAYRLPEVADICQRRNGEYADVEINGITVTVDCFIWREWRDAQERR